MLKIGVLGAGHLGKIHLKLIREIEEFELIGFFDPNKDNADFAASEFGTSAFGSIEQLIDECDVIDIVTPTLSHYDCAVQAIRQSKHIFIEKPITNTVEEAGKLIKLSDEAGIKVQVGHVERYNPAFIAARPYIDQPMFLEGHRLAQFNPRGTDVSVVLDLMIHDLDIVLSTVKSGIRNISASGVAVVSDTPDIANARLEFDNGCVANLTASRISVKNMRKIRFFQRDAYISVDFFKKEAEVIRMKEVKGEVDPLAITMDLGAKGVKQIYFDKPKVDELNAIKTELQDFSRSILEDTVPTVTIHDGYNALEAAHIILDKMQRAGNLVES
ncbi:MAG: Gfo/Idh/MocA family oxidoreductase [Vicingaceae bacterium]